MESRKSVGHLSKTQKQKLLDIMRDRPRLRSGKFAENFTAKDAQREWEDIAVTLNAIPGSKKDWRLWRKSWQDLQSRVKSKKANFIRSCNKTGGGSPPEPMDDFEEGVASLLNSNSIIGHQGVKESLVFEQSTFDPGEGPSSTFFPASNTENLTGILSSSIEISQLDEDRQHPEQNNVIPPPAEFCEDEDTRPTEQNTGEQRTKKKKIHLNSLLNEKIKLKRELNQATIQFYKDYLKIFQEQTNAIKDLVNKFNESGNK